MVALVGLVFEGVANSGHQVSIDPVEALLNLGSLFGALKDCTEGVVLDAASHCSFAGVQGMDKAMAGRRMERDKCFHVWPRGHIRKLRVDRVRFFQGAPLRQRGGKDARERERERYIYIYREREIFV